MKINEFQIGDKAQFSRQITEEDIQKFAELTGDINPIHLNEEYAKKTIFKGRIAHGMLVSSLIATIFGNNFPGNGTIYLSQNIKFINPVSVGDFITAEVEVINIDIERNRLALKTRCYNQDNVNVIIGEAIVMPPM
jgi:3-hydroxybutyryl-CoA dehydratase